MHMTITRPTNGAVQPRGRVRMVNRHGTSLETRPLLCHIDGHQAWVDPVTMPFAGGQFSSVDCFDLLAYVHDDLATMCELARIIKTGGKLLVRVPNQGAMGGFDAYNLCRYLADGTHRGERPPETDELGWRRHFRGPELTSMLETSGFDVVESSTSGTGLPELAQLSAMIGFRWIQRSEERYQRAVDLIDRARGLDERFRTPGFGFSQTVLAVRS
jgi:SAM-dependent methyltransferase